MNHLCDTSHGFVPIKRTLFVRCVALLLLYRCLEEDKEKSKETHQNALVSWTLFLCFSPRGSGDGLLWPTETEASKSFVHRNCLSAYKTSSLSFVGTISAFVETAAAAFVGELLFVSFHVALSCALVLSLCFQLC